MVILFINFNTADLKKCLGERVYIQMAHMISVIGSTLFTFSVFSITFFKFCFHDLSNTTF